MLVTHATANINVCDRDRTLGCGLAIFATLAHRRPHPTFSATAGETRDFADIYLKLKGGDNETANQEKNTDLAIKCLQSNAYRNYVTSSMSPGQKRRTAPPMTDRVSEGVPFWGQLSLLSQRVVAGDSGDRLSQILT